MTLLESELAVFRSTWPARELHVRGETWKYHLVGSHGPGVLMLHGGGGSAESLFRYAVRLAPHLRLLLPSVPVGVRTVGQALDGIRTVMAHEAMAPAHFVGFSMGGMLEQVLLRQQPGIVRSLTLFHCPPPSTDFAHTLVRRSRFMALPTSILAPLVRWRVRRELSGYDLSSPEVQFWAEFYASRATLERTRAHQRIVLDYLRNYSLEPAQLDGWHGPVHIFETETDEVIPRRERERFKKLYPKASVTTFESGGHLGNGIARWREVSDRIEAICLSGTHLA